jgi:RHS repeat-associated protein
MLTNTGSWGTGIAVYDSLGNIRSRKLGPRDIYLQYDNKNRVYQSIDTQAAPVAGAPKISGVGAGGTGTRTVAYDERGNVTTLGTMTFYYDYSDQPTLLSGTKTDGTSLTGNYRYDGNLRRVRNQINGKTIYNVYDVSGKLVHTRDFGSNRVSDYILANGKTIARWGAGHWVYNHDDHLGSTVAATHHNGTVNARMRYAPFGLAMDDPTVLRDGAGFTGHLKDSNTGLNYMQARYYDPVMGRFLSIDPVTFLDTGDTSQFNRYVYASNDPINRFDPNGEDDYAILVGDPGLGRHNVGRNFERSAQTRANSLIANGHTVTTSRVSSVSDMRAALNTSKPLDGAIFFGHATNNALNVGEQSGAGTNLSAGPLGKNISDLGRGNFNAGATFEIFGCNAGTGGVFSIAQEIANQLGVPVEGYGDYMSFSTVAGTPNIGPGASVPDTGNLYMTTDDGSAANTFTPSSSALKERNLEKTILENPGG